MADLLFKVVETSILQKIQLTPEIPSHYIYKVPDYIRKVHKQRYEPSIVSIGPVYCKVPSVEQWQEIKVRYLRSFLGLIGRYGFGLQHCFNVIKGLETNIRSCYENTIDLSREEFIEMILIDAAFIIYLFINVSGDYGCEIHNMGLSIRFCSEGLNNDLFLAENQLPFFVLDNLYNSVFKGANSYKSFRNLTLSFIESIVDIPGKRSESSMTKIWNDELEIYHLVDFLRIYYLPSKLRGSLDYKLRRNRKCIKNPMTAKDLKAAGIKFVASKNEYLLDITFSNGVLMIPKLLFADNTETIFRNLIFFEQTHYFTNLYFIDYMSFLDDLIDTPEDVQILVENDILEHLLGSNKEFMTTINNMLKNIIANERNLYYGDVCQELSAHASKNWNRWKAILRRDYFNHPWSTISVIYAVILFILTVLQVYTGFKQLKQH